ncbi:hypothetical protein [Rhodopirellula sp. SWK7]|uniref:hypothetical protein n=1 Tax=Rhodopirellula sp. SWK7 TaxID=595460 RepID=UPI0005C66062|nr:hypothetical protein [Rhodopirellula sp. SWK7]
MINNTAKFFAMMSLLTCLTVGCGGSDQNTVTIDDETGKPGPQLTAEGIEEMNKQPAATPPD